MFVVFTTLLVRSQAATHLLKLRVNLAVSCSLSPTYKRVTNQLVHPSALLHARLPACHLSRPRLSGHWSESPPLAHSLSHPTLSALLCQWGLLSRLPCLARILVLSAFRLLACSLSRLLVPSLPCSRASSRPHSRPLPSSQWLNFSYAHSLARPCARPSLLSPAHSVAHRLSGSPTGSRLITYPRCSRLTTCSHCSHIPLHHLTRATSRSRDLSSVQSLVRSTSRLCTLSLAHRLARTPSRLHSCSRICSPAR
ncbi:uncharacterized protein B0H18DRAFT_527301 [Fomitopsis serialis]|uniref:uncharacterized protein n=1 Tax=Fomitopsis serialis TaxID=139415 RepID=UPI00200786AB|nr:uncharacterized protein B0H18DRAFT_527301 [Neoantrodia serialis]KAH9922102.1 hypothetical protein B0H18DRAFT_527301 [Neoantrodia serialis]